MTTDEPRYVCPACASEGNNTPQPGDNYYWSNVKPYRKVDDQGKVVAKHTYKDNKRRSILCKKHESQLVQARRRKQLDPTSPTYNAELHEKVKAWHRDYMARKTTPGSDDYDHAFHERLKAAKRSARKRRKDEESSTEETQ